MLTVLRRALPLLLCAAVSACAGGGATNPLPSAPNAGASAQRTTAGSTIAVRDGTVWIVTDAWNVYSYQANSNGNHAPTDHLSLTPYPDASATPADITLGPDNTIHVLSPGSGANGWRLSLYAPWSEGAVFPEQVYDGPGKPINVGLLGDGIAVMSATGDHSGITIATYPYGGGNDPAPLRSVTFGEAFHPGPTPVLDVSAAAVDSNGNVWVATDFETGAAGYPVYELPSGATAPVLKFYTSRAQRDVAVAPDGTLYLLEFNSNSANPNAPYYEVDAYAPGSSYAHPDRVIAPFPTGPTGVGGPHINVNSDGWLFVIFPDHFEAYGSNANGAPAAIRSANFYRAVGNAVAGAIGP